MALCQQCLLQEHSSFSSWCGPLHDVLRVPGPFIPPSLLFGMLVLAGVP